MFLNNEKGCRIFDAQKYPWACRGDFSNLTNEDRNTIETAIGELLRFRKPVEVFVRSNIQDQQQLIDSLQILLSEKGLFHRLNLKRKNARNNCERVLNCKIPDDPNQLRKLKESAEQSLAIWKELGRLSKSM
jgi:hypothetical protein